MSSVPRCSSLVCSKARCKNGDEKPTMILPARQKSFPNKKLFCEQEDEETYKEEMEEKSSSEESDDEMVDDEIQTIQQRNLKTHGSI